MKVTSEGIKSFLRVRPLKSNEEPVLQTTENTVVVRQKEAFTFDHVFNQKDNNNDVFQLTAASMIENSITGFNSCILAYGQTSSGKTYTMKGQHYDPGLIPLTVRRLFQKLSSSDDAYQVKVSYFQIYNQFIIDLLSDKNSNLDIREDINKNITIVDLTQQEVKSEKDAIHIFEQGQMRRKFASTASNVNSSRSHTIFRLELTIVRKKDFYRTFSYINMVDLAGSEGVSKTRAEGTQKRQGDNINKSLLALSNVIRQLSQKEQYVNFRDSKLTRILQSSLVTNSRSVVICTVFPTADNLQQTLNTLKFGTCVNKIKVTSKMNMVDTSKKYAMSTPDGKMQMRSMSKKKNKQAIFQEIDIMQESMVDDLKNQNQALRRELDECKFANKQLKNELGSMDLLLKGANKQLKNYQLQKQDYKDSIANTMRIKDESIAYLNKDVKHLEETSKFWQDKCQKYAQKEHAFVKQINDLKDTIQKYESQIKELRKALNQSLEEGLDQLSKHSVRKNNAKRSVFTNKQNNLNSKISKEDEEDMSSKVYPKKGKYAQILENMRKRPEAIDPMKLQSIVRLSAKVFRLNTCLCQCIKQLTEMDQQNEALHRIIDQKQKRIQQLERGSMSSSKKLDQSGKPQVRQLKRKIENMKAQLKMAKKRQRKLNDHLKRMNDANVRNFQGYEEFIQWKTALAKKMDQQGYINQEQVHQFEENLQN